MKSKLWIMLMLVGLLSASAQTRLPGAGGTDSGSEISFDWSKDEKLKGDIEDIGLTVANQIMGCCSSWGGNNISADIDFEGIKQNSVSGAFTIPMTVRWQGSLSGNLYFVQGKLLVNADGSKSWLKIKDGGGFNPGCSKNCVR